LVARYSGAGDSNYYYADINGSGGALTGRIFVNINGAFRQLASARLTGGGSGIMRFEVVGDSQRLYFDDGTGERLIASATDASLTTAGTVGVRPYGATGTVTYDDFTASRIGTAALVTPERDTFDMLPPEQTTGTPSVRVANVAATVDVSVALAVQNVS